jgi:acetylornithine/succinyldiaminopimelate/putrescine aminotransferase
VKVTAVLAKIPWKNLFRFLPLAIGIAGEYAARSVEEKKADALQRVEEQQQELKKALERLASRIKLLLWVVGAGLVIAIAALIIALVR